MNKKKILLNNTIFLYVLTFSNYFLSFITVPYQTRVLGPEFYGKIGFALAFTTYFQLILDFGFNLSATADVSEHRSNKKKLSQIVYAVLYSKVFLMLISFILLSVIILAVPLLREDYLLYLLFFIAVCLNSFLPDFLYRGLETMKIITYRAVSVKVFFTLMIFIFLKDASQYFYIPIFNILGSLAALAVVYYHVIYKIGLTFNAPKIKEIKDSLQKSLVFFYSRIATSVYDATNLIILGFIYPSGNIVGYYTSTNNLVKTAKSGISPIADSLYPYMVRNKDFKLIAKVLKLGLPTMIIGCTIVGIYAEEICVFVFGAEFKEAGVILQLLLPLVIISLPNYILGFPTLSPLGLVKYANLSTIIGAVIQIVGIAVLFMINELNIYTICILTIFTELSVLSIRIFNILKYVKNGRKQLQ